MFSRVNLLCLCDGSMLTCLLRVSIIIIVPVISAIIFMRTVILNNIFATIFN